MRLLKIILLHSIVLITLFGCKRASQSSPDSDNAELVVRLASGMSPTTKLWEPANLFKQELEKASPEHNIKEGEIKVEFFDQGTIGSERQLLEATFFDVIDVIQINTSVVTTVEPSYAVLNLPYLFVNDQHLQHILYGDVGQQMLDKLQEHRLQGLNFFSAGFRNMFYQSEQCAETPEGLNGLKIRVMESPIMISGINAIGPSATPIPFSELYQSIRTGVVDGAENSINVFVSSRFYEAGINCFTFTEHTTDQHVMIANSNWLESLPSNYRERIKEVSKEIVPEFNKIWDKETQNALEEIKKQGVRVNRVQNKKEFINQVEHIAEQFLEDQPAFSRELYQQIKAVEQKFISE
jgi:tripartite ATP-independent transporter DctP family solute receptor